MTTSSTRNVLEESLASRPTFSPPRLELESGSRVAVLGGGPAGSFFSYFLLEMANRVGLDLHLDIYERRIFSTTGPAGCNMCGGIISESLVQTLATEGINLPTSVVERGIDSYVLHMDVGDVRIDTPLQEKRIASVHRGAGPKGMKEKKWESFDAHLQQLALNKGARLVQARVEDISLTEGRPHLKTRDTQEEPYDLLAVAVGVNTGVLKIFENLPIQYQSPKTTGTYISEFYLGEEVVEEYLGTSMHVFLLNIPRLEFAALIPKGDYVSLCLLGRDIDQPLVQAFLDSAEVKRCMPKGWILPQTFCHCSPKINLRAAPKPYADRIVFIGDSGASRLYKDGIGAAYRTAKAAANTAIFEGISSESFKKHFLPVCRHIENDNKVGKLIFIVTRDIQRRRFERRGVLRMVSKEQKKKSGTRHMSTVLWDTFTGSAPYTDIFRRTLHPGFLGVFLWEIVAGFWPFKKRNTTTE
ncbi:MAG: hypothetical protein WBG01_12440 [Bacteroidota bacterium]